MADIAKSNSEPPSVEDIARLMREHKAKRQNVVLFMEDEVFDAFQIQRIQPIDIQLEEYESDVLGKIMPSLGIPPSLFGGITTYRTPFLTHGVCDSVSLPRPKAVEIERPVWPALLVAAVLAAVTLFLKVVQ